jgi:hypothetical protein
MMEVRCSSSPETHRAVLSDMAVSLKTKRPIRKAMAAAKP